MTEPRDDVALLRELLAKATAGPWQIGRMGDKDMHHVVDMGRPAAAPFMMSLPGSSMFGPSGVCHSDDGSSEANAALIVAAVNALPDLLDRLERVEKALRELVKIERRDNLTDTWYEQAWDNARAALQPSKEQG